LEKKIPCKILTSTVRKVCRKFRDEADYLMGNYVVLDDSLSELMEWASEVAIQSACIKSLVKPLGRWCPKNPGKERRQDEMYLRYPHLLKEVKMDGKISVGNLHEILTSCRSVETLSIFRNVPKPFLDDYGFGYIGTFQVLVQKYGSLTNYPAFHNLRKIELEVCADIHYKFNVSFLDGFVLPLLEFKDICIKLHTFTLMVKSEKKYTKIIFDRLLEFFHTKVHMKYLKLKLMKPSYFSLIHPTSFIGDENMEAEGAQERRKNINFPQLDELSLEIADSENYYTWFSLIESQCRLTNLKSSIGTLFWKYYYLPVTNCSKTLTKICLRELKTFNINDRKSHPINLEMFSDCERLISLDLSGYATYYGNDDDIQCRLKNFRKLPQCIKHITLESFKIEPQSVYELHDHLVNMDQLNLLYWNIDYTDLKTSIDIIKDMLENRDYQQIFILDWKTLIESEEKESQSDNPIEDLVDYIQQNRHKSLKVEYALSTALTFGIHITRDETT